MKYQWKNFVTLALVIAAAVVVLGINGCGSGGKLVPRAQVQAPAPREDSLGKYLCPYTSDEVVAEWVEKGKNASIGGAVGGALGKEAGKSILKKIPFIGGKLGRAAGNKAGVAAAVKLAGGWDYIRETSDLSFDDIDAMMAYLYVNYYGSNEHWDDVRRWAGAIYPELQDQNRWVKASKKFARG